MKFFAGYLKKHSFLAILIVLLLAAEAVLCLVTPALFGNIVDTGIMCKGFGDEYPKVVSRSAFALFSEVLPQTEYEKLESLYSLSAEFPETLDDKYKTDKFCYFLVDDENAEEAAELYRNAVMSAILSVREVSGYDKYNYNDFLDKFSLSSLNMLVGSVSLSEKTKNDNFAEASQTDASVKLQVASILLAYIYDDAGIDCKTVQQKYITDNAITMGICVVCQLICVVMSTFMISGFSSGLEKDIRVDVMKKAFTLKKEDLRTITPAMISGMMKNDSASIGLAMNYVIRALVYSLIVAVAGCVLTFMHNAVFGWLILGCSVFIMIVAAIIYAVSNSAYIRMQKSYSEYFAVVRKNLDLIFSIRALNAQKTEHKRADAITALIRKDESFVMKLVISALSFAGLLMNIMTAVAIVLGGEAMLTSGLPMRYIVTDLQYSFLVVSSFMMVGAIIVFIPRAVISLKKVDTIIEYKVNIENNYERRVCPDSAEEISFSEVRLFENSAEISFSARKGQLVLITGETGTGKTLLADAMMREFEPFSGKILLNGSDITEFDDEYGAKYFSVMKSTPTLFSDTLRRNMILYGAADDDAVMLEALKKAHCDFMPSHQGALEIFLKNGGEKYSGGQRTRLNLACVMAKKAQVYIFDDCLNAVNKEMRAEIYREINELKKEAVVFVISNNAEGLEVDKTVNLHF